jgi:hypothetical protein
MKSLPRYLLFSLLATCLILPGCNSVSSQAPNISPVAVPRQGDRPQPILKPSRSPASLPLRSALPPQSDKQLNKQLTNQEKTITVNIYQPDLYCEKLVAKPAKLSIENALNNTIQKILEEGDLNLGYRVILDQQKKSATIDLRVASNSPRQINSLSVCEQLVVFGGLEKTLINHKNWQIQQVNFTLLGKQILL